MINVFIKCCDIIKSCETIDQLKYAMTYVVIAKGGQYINRGEYIDLKRLHQNKTSELTQIGHC